MAASSLNDDYVFVLAGSGLQGKLFIWSGARVSDADKFCALKSCLKMQENSFEHWVREDRRL